MVSVLIVPIYLVGTLLDQVIAISLEKRDNLYPMIDFTCFCGFKIKLLNRWMVPTHLYKYYKLRQHMRGCLQWILNVDMNGLTPYWGHTYASDLRDETRFSFLTKEYFLAEAKKRSDNVKAGRSPWFDPLGKIRDA